MRRCTRPPVGASADLARALQALVPELVTDRLRLRAPRLEDLPHWTAVWQDHAPGDSDEKLWLDFCVYSAGWLLNGHGLWTIARRDDDAIVGFVSLGLEWDDDEPEIGWAILPAHRRQGYATEAGRRVRAHAFETLGRGAAVSYVAPGNAASNAVALGLGAVRDPEAEAACGGGIHVWRHGARPAEGRAR